MKKYVILQWIVGIAILAFMLFTTDYREVFQAITSLSVPPLLIAVMLYLGNSLLMSFRIHRILRYRSSPTKLSDVFWAHMGGMLASDVTPAKSGYMYTLIPLRKVGVPFGQGAGAITYCYTFDLLLKLVIGFVGIAFLLTALRIPYHALTTIWLGFFSVVLLVLAALIFFWVRFPDRLLRILGRYKIGRAFMMVKEEGESIFPLTPLIMGISVAGWILRGFEWFFISRAVGLDLTLPISMILHPTLTSLAMVPLGPSGLGIQEFGIAQAVGVLGFRVEAGVAFAILARAVDTFVDLLGLKSFFVPIRYEAHKLPRVYERFCGSIDEDAYNSKLLVQRFWQRRRVREVLEEARISPGEVILDIGCGSGVISRKCAERGGVVVGIDFNPNVIRFAHSKRSPNTHFLVADAHHLPFRSEVFDKVICSEVLEHTANPKMVCDEIYSVLKCGGMVCVSTPNTASLWPLFELLWDFLGRGRRYREIHIHKYDARKVVKLLQPYEMVREKTLFVISPLFALLGSKFLLRLGVEMDKKLEEKGIGALILMCGRKR